MSFKTPMYSLTLMLYFLDESGHFPKHFLDAIELFECLLGLSRGGKRLGRYILSFFNQEGGMEQSETVEGTYQLVHIFSLSQFQLALTIFLVTCCTLKSCM